MHNWGKDEILPRTVFIPYYVARLGIGPVGFLRRQLDSLRASPAADRLPRLCIESGIRGWELLEYKELYASACEYLGTAQVHKVAIDREQDYISQVRAAFDTYRPTHYLYDPRTGSQGTVKGLAEAFQMSLLLSTRNVVPIALLTDLAIRRWRAQCGVVTANRGITVNYLSSRVIHPIFPHRRLIGPHLFPLSASTLDALVKMRERKQESDPPTAVFAGSLYEPRTTKLRLIKEGLAARGLQLEMKGREIGSTRFSDEDYWSRLMNASLIVTTADQIQAEGLDWTWVQHLLYRYLETLACGTLLVAPEIPGVRRYFTPGVHFVPFKSTEEAVEVIAHYLENRDARERIAAQGHERAQELVRSRAYWCGIDVALLHDSLT